MGILKDYLTSKNLENLNREMLTFVANIDMVARKNPFVAKIIVKELIDQRRNLKLIASENFCSFPAQNAMSNLLTDIVLVNVADLGLTGRQAENALRECGLTLNRNAFPYDENGSWYTSGLRLGTPAVTTLGMGRDEMMETADIMAVVLKNVKPSVNKKGVPSKTKYVLDENIKIKSTRRTTDILDRFILHPEINIDFFVKYF